MNQEKIGEFLIELRKENNFTQEDLADKLNVNVKSISRWENGNNMPDHSTIMEICKLYHISVDEFYKGERIKKNIKIRKIFLFYFLISLISLFVLPFLGIVSPTFIVCSILIPIATLIDVLTLLITGAEVPYISFADLHPLLAFPLSIIISIIMFLIGIFAWKLLLKYLKFIKDKANNLYIDL